MRRTAVLITLKNKCVAGRGELGEKWNKISISFIPIKVLNMWPREIPWPDALKENDCPFRKNGLCNLWELIIFMKSEIHQTSPICNWQNKRIMSRKNNKKKGIKNATGLNSVMTKRKTAKDECNSWENSLIFSHLNNGYNTPPVYLYQRVLILFTFKDIN